jgi:hypothetical protein
MYLPIKQDQHLLINHRFLCRYFIYSLFLVKHRNANVIQLLNLAITNQIEDKLQYIYL